jgi:hypothetical protein
VSSKIKVQPSEIIIHMKENSGSFLPPPNFTFTRFSVIDYNGKQETEALAKEYGVLVLAVPSIPITRSSSMVRLSRLHLLKAARPYYN